MGANTYLLEEKGIDWICERIAGLASLTAVANEVGCAASTIVEWIHSNPERSARARDVRAWTAWAWDEKAEYDLLNAKDGFELQKARELAHHYRWRASKIAPKIYGDKLEVQSDSKITVLVTRNNGDIVDVTPKNISKDEYKQVGVEGGVCSAGVVVALGNPTSTAQSTVSHTESDEEPKPKKKSILHSVGGVIRAEMEREKDTK